MTVGERLKQARKAAQMSGEKLGALIGVSKGQISNIEKGASDLTRSNAIVLAQALGVSLEWLLTGEGNEQATNYNSAGRNLKIGNQAGRDVSIGSGDCEQKLAAAYKEIEHLQERLKDKDQMIALLMKSQG